ncbi:uncharacterized protein BP5553_04261 [Venustampulla echinocandica]|uniref:Uncharacterized protein n=1 Tax=Venustampulla echinocandica TaxID=2656787 RepID=A0A370TWM3_9HELO|nr:uncharacterized protein BP5553_04261 [Venustampulla echinocandica]RDL39921.1 hypothetical protein BP5553_04261 [Venustampulla echinocandica]
MFASVPLFLALAGSALSTPANVLFKRGDTVDNNSCFNDPNLPAPQPKSLGGLDHNWMTLHCDIPEVANVGGKYSPRERWVAAQATNALAAAQICWIMSKDQTANKFTFSQSVSNFIHGKDGMKCEILDASGGSLSGCSETSVCDEAGHAAGFQILNSMATIHRVHQGTYDALEAAKVNIIGRVGEFAKVFSPRIDELRALKIFLDVIGMGFALAAAPVWNSALKVGWLASNGNTLGTLKDSVNGMVSNGLTLGKDVATQANSALGAQNSLSNRITILINAWKQKVADTNAMMFSGSNDHSGMQLLLNMMDEGKLLDYTDIVKTSLAGPIIERILWAIMIPWAWSMSNAGIYPFIMISDDEGERNRCTNLETGKKYIADYEKVFVCVDGKSYWLVNVAGGAQVSCGYYDQDVICEDNYFSPLPGTDQLLTNGKNNPWGSLTIGDIVTSSINSYKANGNKPGFVLDMSKGSSVDELASKGVQAAGVFTLPICTREEAWYNWFDGPLASKAKNYPCN